MNCSEALLYFYAVMMGVCCLFPYNSFFASPSYIANYYKFAAVKDTDDVSTLPQSDISFWPNSSTWVMLLMLIPMLVSQIILLLPCMIRLNMQVRMIVGCIFLIVVMLLVPVCAAGGGMTEGGALAVMIITPIVCGFATTMVQATEYAVFGPLPTRYMTAYVLGGGLSGCVNSVLRIIIASALPSTFHGVKTGAVIFFCICIGLMVVTVAIVVGLRYHPIVLQMCTAYMGDFCAPKEVDNAELDEEIASPYADRSGSVSELLEKTEHVTEGVEPAQSVEVPSDERLATQTTESTDDAVAAAPAEEGGSTNIFTVMKRIWMMMLCLCVTMFTTLTLFPGVGLAAMQSSDDTNTASSASSEVADGAAWEPEAIMPMVIILMYNAGDFVGRFLTNFRIIWIPEKTIPIMVIARIVVCVVPLVLGTTKPKIINSNANPIVIFLVLGLTNGYLIGLTMAYGTGSKLLVTQSERSKGGLVMCFSLLVGMALGSVLSLLILTFKINA